VQAGARFEGAREKRDASGERREARCAEFSVGSFQWAGFSRTRTQHRGTRTRIGRSERRQHSRIAERWQHLAMGVNPWIGCQQPIGAAAAGDCWRRSAAPDGWGGRAFPWVETHGYMLPRLRR